MAAVKEYIAPRYWLAPNVDDAVEEISVTSVVIKKSVRPGELAVPEMR